MNTMQYTINKAAFEALAPEIQAEYTLDGETATLKVEADGGAPLFVTDTDPAALGESLKTAEKKREIEAEHRRNAEKRAEKLQADLEGAGGDKAAIQKIKDDHAAELEKIRTERADEQKAAVEARHNGLRRDTAKEFAEKHFTTPSLVSPLFAGRLSVENIDGQDVVRVLDADGKASALGLDELKKEFLDNAEYKSIVKAQVGSGGGATGKTDSGGATGKKLSEMSLTERATLERTDPDTYTALKAEEG